MKILWNASPQWVPKLIVFPRSKTTLLTKCILLGLLACFFSLKAQITLVGRVLDTHNKDPLVYVNIGVVNKEVGTVSDAEGYFTLVLEQPTEKQDSLRFSMLGYESKSFLLDQFLEEKPFEIYLNEQSFALEEVVLISPKKKYRNKLLGNKTKSNLIYTAFTTNQLGNEMGIVIRGRKTPMKLEYLEFNIVENDYGPIRFRLNIYNLKEGLPNQNILTENVFIDTDLESGVVRVDLIPYDLTINEDFFVALEWIEDLGPGKLYFSGGFFGNSLIARSVSQGSWKRVGNASMGMLVNVRY